MLTLENLKAVLKGVLSSISAKSVSKTVLWEGDIVSTGQLTLTDDISKYFSIIIVTKWGTNGYEERYITVDQLITTSNDTTIDTGIRLFSDDHDIWIKYLGNNVMSIPYFSNTSSLRHITKIYGCRVQ